MNIENFNQRLARFRISLQSVQRRDMAPTEVTYFMLNIDELIDDVLNGLFSLSLSDEEKTKMSQALEEVLAVRRELNTHHSTF